MAKTRKSSTEVETNKVIEQEVHHVDMDAVKKALKVLITKEESIVGMLYEKHAEYNKKFFGDLLSLPIITIERMSNKKLGTYTIDGHALKLKNHIKFNPNFIALNTEERILETLRHEMIHQLQDEILYTEDENEVGKEVEIGEYLATKRKKPKEWHNKDFRDWAEVVGIPAIGKNCVGNPAIMPEPKSYNRKFICGCVASNGFPVTVWSTREIDATCNACGEEFMEVEKQDKRAQTIEIKKSHVEQDTSDAVFDMYEDKYDWFMRFKEKDERDTFIEKLPEGTMKEHGVYQKNHKMYGMGYRYWLAYTEGVSE